MKDRLLVLATTALLVASGQGLAADIAVKGVSPKEVADYIQNKPGFVGGLGRYQRFTHVDVRGKQARWGRS